MELIKWFSFSCNDTKIVLYKKFYSPIVNGNGEIEVINYNYLFFNLAFKRILTAYMHWKEGYVEEVETLKDLSKIFFNFTCLNKKEIFLFKFIANIS